MTMVEAYLEQQLSERWEKAYWVASLMSVHTKRPVKPEKLMKPFLPPKTKEEIQKERDQFFAEFEARRKEESHGDHS